MCAAVSVIVCNRAGETEGNGDVAVVSVMVCYRVGETEGNGNVCCS